VTLHRLTAASGLVSIALLAGGANAALALAQPHSGSGNGGGSGSSSSGGSPSSHGGHSSPSHSGSSSSHTGSSSNSGGTSSSHTGSSSNSGSGSSSHGPSSQSGSSGTGSSSTSSSGSSGSSSSSSSSSDGEASSAGGSTPSGTSSPNPLAGLPGQIGQTLTQVTGAITNGIASAGGNLNDSKDGHSGTAKRKPKTSSPAAGTTPSTDTTADSTNSPTLPSANVATDPPKQTPTTKTSIPSLIAQVPLSALDVIKTEIPLIAAAIPLPGMSALPAIADALITPLQQAVSGLASAADGLPFMQFDMNQTIAVPSQLSTNRYQRSGPSTSIKPKTAGPDPLTRGSGIAEAPALPPKAPQDPAKPDQIFSASSHFTNQQDFRPGYPDYLRAAGLSEVAAVAVPGFAGILTITCAGGLLGYRQARAGRATAPSRAARFVS
jgi:hypothetical protein